MAIISKTLIEKPNTCAVEQPCVLEVFSENESVTIVVRISPYLTALPNLHFEVIARKQRFVGYDYVVSYCLTRC